MDVSVCANTKQNHAQGTIRKQRRIKPDLYRLSTFRTWKTNTQSTMSPAVLAKVGFSYTGTSDKVLCQVCHLEIDSWKSGMDPKQEHMERSPNCAFVKAQADLFVKDESAVPTASFLNCNGNALNSNTIKDIGSGKDDEQISFEPKKHLLGALSSETIDRARTYTFSNWPTITPSAQDMACAGWWYTNIADRVICIYCDAMFHNWTELDRPFEIHRQKSPNCFFIRAPNSNVNDNKNQIRVLDTIETSYQLQTVKTIVGAVNAQFSLITDRFKSFDSLPETDKSSMPSIDLFAEAGFFYTGDKTIVRCFYCNGALRNWQATDDPKVEHARWFPQCAYIRQFIGENLYQAIQRKNQELRAQQIFRTSTDGEPAKFTPWTSDEIDRMVKARLDLPVVEKLRQENYSMPIIRKVFEMQLRFKKDDFKTDVDLRVACLILEKQVKLINGKESNILIPQTWFKNRMREGGQGQGDEKKTESQQASEILQMEIPKVIEPVVAQRKLTAKKVTDEHQPCVLCLTTERQVACLPCGHLTSCVACGHSLKTCPICRASVKAYVRIYT